MASPTDALSDTLKGQSRGLQSSVNELSLLEVTQGRDEANTPTLVLGQMLSCSECKVRRPGPALRSAGGHCGILTGHPGWTLHLALGGLPSPDLLSPATLRN